MYIEWIYIYINRDILAFIIHTYIYVCICFTSIGASTYVYIYPSISTAVAVIVLCIYIYKCIKCNIYICNIYPSILVCVLPWPRVRYNHPFPVSHFRHLPLILHRDGETSVPWRSRFCTNTRQIITALNTAYLRVSNDIHETASHSASLQAKVSVSLPPTRAPTYWSAASHWPFVSGEADTWATVLRNR